MIEKCNALLLELEEQLKFISLETDNSLVISELSVNVIQKSINILKSFIRKYNFRSTAEEIRFFKEFKPQFCSKLFYNISIYNIESNRPNGGHKVLKKFLQKELEKLKQYFYNNLDFYKYYRTGSNHLDHKYFVRGKQDIRLFLETFNFETDPDFSTSHDFRVSMILANDLLQVYLENELSLLEKKEPTPKSQVVQKSEIKWTGSKAALIELMYALHSEPVLNNGNVELRQIALLLENTFNVELGQYHRTFMELRTRKGARTKFLDNLRDALNQRMEFADEKINLQ